MILNLSSQENWLMEDYNYYVEGRVLDLDKLKFQFIHYN